MFSVYLNGRSVGTAISQTAEEVPCVDEGQAVLVHAARDHQPPQPAPYISPPAAIALRTPAPIVHLPHTAAEIPPAAIITD